MRDGLQQNEDMESEIIETYWNVNEYSVTPKSGSSKK